MAACRRAQRFDIAFACLDRAGDAEAAFALGAYSLRGVGLERSDPVALRWMRRFPHLA